ncbi:hypothetical protein L7F22_064151 [Adiantum nelumboides]|nr:hypothetical protein [Adiantum nelumboides]
MEKRARDAKTGLLYHGYDESWRQAWADPETGRSPSFWGRAVGWYFMALVDTLDFFPSTHAKRDDLVAILQRLAEAVAKVQDPAMGVWWEVLDQGGRQGNYLESSASCMFAYGKGWNGATSPRTPTSRCAARASKVFERNLCSPTPTAAWI